MTGAASPNILFFQVDQLAASVLRAYGDPVCHTPHLDALAARGAVFESAYCNFPLCSPSRASMATGRLCSDIGAYDNAAELPASIPTYAHHLRNAGYRTALSGKMHFIGPDQFHGFETRLTPDLYPADFAWVPNWGDEGKRDTNDARSVTVSGVCARSIQIEFDEEVTFQAERFLYDHAQSDDARPFFLQVSWTHPHEPYLCLQEFWDLYEGVDLPPIRTPALTEAEHDAHSVRLLRDFAMLGVIFDPDDIARARRAYYGAVSYVDTLVGRVMGALERAGLVKDTVIVFTSDHGEMLGERGMWFKKHFFDPSLRVPLMMAGPGIDVGRVFTPASLVDLLPTFMGVATGSGWDGDGLEGRDLTTLMTAPSDPEREIYAEYLAESTPAPILMIRRGRWKYVWSADDPPLLFDAETDPEERVNRAGDPTCAEVEASLHAAVQAKWDNAALTAEIKESQARRILIRSAQSTGAPQRWNHGETPGQPVRWYRGQGSYNDWAFDHLPVGKDG